MKGSQTDWGQAGAEAETDEARQIREAEWTKRCEVGDHVHQREGERGGVKVWECGFCGRVL